MSQKKIQQLTTASSNPIISPTFLLELLQSEIENVAFKRQHAQHSFEGYKTLSLQRRKKITRKDEKQTLVVMKRGYNINTRNCNK